MTEIKTNRVWKEGMELRPRWSKLFDEIGKKHSHALDESAKLALNLEYAKILNSYSEPHRFYHTPRHLLDCLKEFEGVENLAASPIAVALALWFHDVVYDPKADDNEAKSADYAKKVLLPFGAAAKFIDYVGKCILATTHRTPISNLDEALTADIDLSIFGRPEDAFNDYEQRIRREYLWVPEDEYRELRKQILQSFGDRPKIYHTDHFRQKYEVMARKNLERTIVDLSK
jgi:predicted metal-dependent HD superfamily phosphohydrolase